jgi:hypothetical protein
MRLATLYEYQLPLNFLVYVLETKLERITLKKTYKE